MIKIPHSMPFLTEEDSAAIERALTPFYVGFDEDIDLKIQMALKNFFNYNFVQVTPSASLALLLIFKICKIKDNDEIIMSAINCWSVYNTIKMEYAIPVICDTVSSLEFRTGYDEIVSKISDKTRVVILTHMFGVTLDRNIVYKLKINFPDIILIEDFSTSFCGVTSQLELLSDFGIASFGSTKPLTGGIGGVLFSKVYAISGDYDAPNDEYLSFNLKISKMDQLLLLNQIRQYESCLVVKRKLLNFYGRFVTLYGGVEHNMFRAITFDKIDALIDYLAWNNIVLDFRTSAQPNLAKNLGLETLTNSMNFKEYISLPLNNLLYMELQEKKLL